MYETLSLGTMRASVLSPALRTLSHGSPSPSLSRLYRTTATRGFHVPSAVTASQARRRPTLRPGRHHWPWGSLSKRTIYIQTQTTPSEYRSPLRRHGRLTGHMADPDALKFLPNHPVLPEGFPSTFLEYTSPRSTVSPPHPSPLASKLLGVDGVTSVFYGPDFITVTKAADVNWAHIKPEVFSLVTESITSGEEIVNTVDQGRAGDGHPGRAEDSLAENEDDGEVVALIKELLETRIRPAIQEDGGDIEYRGFEDGQVLLKLRGACRTCDSSTVTLKNGIESMLMHYVSGRTGPSSRLSAGC